MANGRSAGKRKGDAGREAGGFVALPWLVLDSPAYLGLSHPAKALLLEVARQFHGDDNGRMLLSAKYLAARGWRSPAVIQRAKRELLEAELIFETVKGGRPNKASWYAITWRTLDKLPGFDHGAALAFERGAYRKPSAKPVSRNAALTTPPVVIAPPIAISPVVERPSATTPPVAIRRNSGRPPTTSPVHPLEMPSPGARMAVEAEANEGQKHGRPSNDIDLGEYSTGSLLDQLKRRMAARQA